MVHGNEELRSWGDGDVRKGKLAGSVSFCISGSRGFQGVCFQGEVYLLFLVEGRGADLGVMGCAKKV